MKKIFDIILVLILFLVGGVLYGLLGTSYGARYLANYTFPRYVPAQQKKFGSVEGSLNKQVTFRDLEFVDLAGFPPGSIIKIQGLTIIPSYRNWKESEIVVENGRLFMPNSDPVVFRGRFYHGEANFNIYTALLSVKDLVGLIRIESGKRFSGFIRNGDLYITGPAENLKITSHFFADKITNPDFTLSNSTGDLDLTVSGIKSRQNQVYGGFMTFDGGQLITRNVKFELVKTKVQVGSAIYETIFDIKATAQVEDVAITLRLKGTRSNPEIELNSFPPYPQDALFMMLTTGKSWGSMEGQSDQQVAADMAGKMMDFFLVSSWPGDLAQKFGILDPSVKFDNQTRGVGIRTKFLKNITIGYEIDQQNYQQQSTIQQQQQQQQPQVKQTVGGELKLNKQLSVSAQKELQREDRSVVGADPTTVIKPDDQLLLKFKKNF